MKKLLFVLLFFSISNFCQAQCSGVSIYSEAGTGKNYVEVNERLVVGDVSFYMMKFEEGEVLIEVSLEGGLQEFSGTGSVSFLLAGGKVVEVKVGRKDRRRGVMIFLGVFGGDMDLQELMGGYVDRITIFDASWYRQVEFSGDDAERFRGVLNCIYEADLK